MEKLTFIIKVEKYTVIVMKVNFSIDLFGVLIEFKMRREL